MIKKLLVLSLSVALIFAAAGVDVNCNSTTDSTTCGSAAASTWTQGASGKFKISECNNVGNSFSNIYDTFCASCPQGGNSNIYANSSKSGCVSTAVAGTNVACQQGNACTTNTCGALPSPAFTWSKASDANNCFITSCLSAPMPNSGLTDNFCNSCQSTNKFANAYGTACVNPANGSCTRKTNWTDDDCKLCNAGGNNSANVKASSDKSSCVAASSSSSVIAVSALLVASLLI
ncbi:cell surface immobilization antigen (macronuclear) [Tetrahymena thermophila SB210]|uniref:Cell surface immobilization antigen n=1 Tax=Tetrahymena thermophila (strain SB210) TaxID=312017 RepID=Q23JD1_TETTS|nr:cell surface immobilization antigen [Tetrahymena thermophila SB210]EAR96573.1 cell surface immobilization antigen [Tetrahymena thermophila SB210]|eukprot:XP_001016818.1 cell surface immobilization antigen [Tetrahymena thermophila SB210]